MRQHRAPIEGIFNSYAEISLVNNAPNISFHFNIVWLYGTGQIKITFIKK